MLANSLLIEKQYETIPGSFLDPEKIVFHSMGAGIPEWRSFERRQDRNVRPHAQFEQGVLPMRWFMLAVAVPLLAMNGGAGAEEIRAVHTDKCLDVTGASQAAGARIIQFVCRQGGNQRWFVDKAKNGTAQIKSLHSGMCMDVDAGAVGNNASIIQFPCKKAGTKAARNQTFRIKVVPGSSADDQRVTIVNVLSNRCLDIDSASPFDGAGLIQFTCLKQPNQQFRIR